MKVWRGIALGFWGIFLAVLLVLSSVYFLVFQTVMNQQEMMSRLERAGFYVALRDSVLVPRVVSAVSEKAAFTPLLTREMVESSVKSAFTDQKMAEIERTVAPAVYAWLDNKSPEISFTIPISEELEAAQQHLSALIEAKLKTLPDCTSYYVEPEVVTRAECMPQYTSVEEVVQGVMSSLDSAVAEAPTELTPETVGLAKSQLGSSISIPDYLSYLWSIVYITVPLAVLTILYLIFRRKGVGLIVVGSVVLVLALALAGGAVFLDSIPPFSQALAISMIDVVKPLVTEKLHFLALTGAISGIVSIIIGIIWIRQKKRRESKRYASTDRGD